MRTDNSIINVKVNLISQIISMFTKFIGRMIFVKVLSSEYLGINGLFTNILTLLSLADMGLENVLIYSMYKPLSEKNENKIKSLTNYYQKIYRIIALIVFVVGCSLIPFLKYLIKDLPDIQNISLIYFLYLINTVVSYFCIYKTSIITADQKGYIVTIGNQIFNIISTILTSIVLVLTKNFIVYLFVQIVISILANIYMSKKAEKLYPCIKNVKGYDISKNEVKEIKKNTFALLFHKIGGVIVCGTDNIIISMMVGIKEVGLYSNYVLITNAITTISSQITNSITASVGNLSVTNNKEHVYDVFKKTFFINSWLTTFCTVCLFALLNSFISIWIGADYVFNQIIVFIIVIKFYVESNRKSVITFRNAMGIFTPDKWKPIFEAVLNLIISIILAKSLGITGVLLGTILSMLIATVFVESYVLYKYGFKMKYFGFVVDYVKSFIIMIIDLFVVTVIVNSISGVGLISFIIKLCVTVLISNLILILFSFRKSEFKYFVSLVFNRFIFAKKKKN